MKKFEYLQPTTLKEAADELLKESSSIPYSGGTDALGLLKDYIVEPEKVINLKNIKGMDEVSYKAGKGLEIGALVKIAEVAKHKTIKEKYAILSDAAELIASPQLRNMGTVGGNLCQRPRCYYFRGDFDCLRKGGDMCYAVNGQNKYHCIVGGGPCYIVYPSDLAVALLALNAKVEITSPQGVKQLPIAEFYVLPEKDYHHENVLKQGELVTKIIVPELTSGTKSKYIKFMERNVWDFAVVSVGAVVVPNGSSLKSGRIAFGGVAPAPWEIKELNSKLTGLQISDDSLDKLTSNLFSDAAPLEKNGYKVPLSRNLVKRILKELAA